MNGSCVETVQGLQKLNLAFIFRNSTQLNLDAFLKSIISLFVTFSAILQKMLDDLKDIDHQGHLGCHMNGWVKLCILTKTFS